MLQNDQLHAPGQARPSDLTRPSSSHSIPRKPLPNHSRLDSRQKSSEGANDCTTSLVGASGSRRGTQNAAYTLRSEHRLLLEGDMAPAAADTLRSGGVTGYRRRKKEVDMLEKPDDAVVRIVQPEQYTSAAFTGLDTSIPCGSFEDPFGTTSDSGTTHSRRASNKRTSVQYFPAGSVRKVSLRDGGSPDGWPTRGIRVVTPSEAGLEDAFVAEDSPTREGVGTTEQQQLSSGDAVCEPGEQPPQPRWPASRALDAGTSSQEGSSPAISRRQEHGSPLTTEDKRSSKYIRSIYDAGGDLFNLDQTSSSNYSSPPRGNDSAYAASTDVSRRGTRYTSPPPSAISRIVGLSSPQRSTSEYSSRHSTSHREPHERAGGFEDWTGVEDGEVDRFGFVRTKFNPKRASAPLPSTFSPSDSPSRSLQGRMSSMASFDTRRSQLEVPKSKGSLRSSGSLLRMRSTRSTSASLKALLSHRQRQLEEAQDMLPAATPEADELTLSRTAEDAGVRQRGQLQAKREQKWRKMGVLSGGMTPAGHGKPITIRETTYRFNTNDAKLISRAWKGIPDSMRGQAWYSFLETAASQHSTAAHPSPTEDELIARFHELKTVDFAEDTQIDLDMNRTIGAHICFRRQFHGGQKALFFLLHALALYFPAVGYVQGMAPIAATLLIYLEPEKAFVAAVRLWMYRGIAYLYGSDFSGLMVTLEEFNTNWLQRSNGPLLAIHKKLEDLGGIGMMWATKWYLTLFQYALPYEAHLRILDVFILLGSEKGEKGRPNVDVLHSVTAALLLGMREQIVKEGAQFEDVMGLLTNKVVLRGSEDGVEGGRGMDALMYVAKGEYRERQRAGGR